MAGQSDDSVCPMRLGMLHCHFSRSCHLKLVMLGRQRIFSGSIIFQLHGVIALWSMSEVNAAFHSMNCMGSPLKTNGSGTGSLFKAMLS